VRVQLTDYRTQIRAYVFDTVRAAVPRIILDDVFTVRCGAIINSSPPAIK
jgi:hypothetical protein